MLMRKFYALIVLGFISLQAFAQEPKEFCLENDAAHRYLTEVTYDSEDYTYTKILDYCDPVPYRYYKYDGYRKDQPLPVGIKLASAMPAAGTLYVSETEDFADSYTMAVAAGVDSINVYNLIPGKTYNYKVQYDDNGVMTNAQSGQFKTTGTLRMLKIDGIFNVRDLGGWTGLGGHKMKYGLLFRGSRMTANSSAKEMITLDGKKAMLAAGIKGDLDLRTSSERNLSASPLASGTGATVDYKPIDDSYKSRIATFAKSDASIRAIQWIIDELKVNKPVYFHCSVGADRTGTVAFLIEALCGMSEDAISKEFELTSFSADSVVTSGKIEDLRRRRTYDGRFDNSEGDYKFANLIKLAKQLPGTDLQRKIFNHLNTGITPDGGTLSTKISADDLNFLIKTMVDYVVVTEIATDGGTKMTMQPGQTQNLNAVVKPATATEKTISFKSSNEKVATVSDEGVITAVRGGTATIQVKADNYVKNITVNVPLVESYIDLPDTIRHNGKIYLLPKSRTNLIKNGSFEYADSFLNWKGANDKPLSPAGFELVKYENSDSLYLQSKADGDSTSFKSLRTMWSIKKDKTYVFGYRVKNSQEGFQITENPYMKTSLLTLKPVDIEASGDDFTWDTPSPVSQRVGERGDMIDSLTFDYPTYGSEWTDVRYFFTNTDGHEYIQVWFTHLTGALNHTCLDNFYLIELTDITWVNPVFSDRVSDGRIYNLAGQEVTNPGRGVYIKDGKKYIVK